MIPFRSKKYQEKVQTNAPEKLDAAGQWILRRNQLPEYRFALELLTHEEKTAFFWRDWGSLDELAQRDLAISTYNDAWYELLAGYPNLSSSGRLQVLEALGYIHNAHVVEFLVGELKRDDEATRLAATNALKHQDPALVIEPMLEALARPEVFLASRIFDVLRTIGPKLVPVVLQMIEEADLQGQVVMVQILGAFGDESVLPVLACFAQNDDYLLRKSALEAMAEIGTPAILPAMTHALNDKDWQIRLIAAQAIERHNLSDGLPFLRQALSCEHDPLLQEMLSEIIHHFDKTQAPITYLWQRQGKDDDKTNGTKRFRKNRSRGRIIDTIDFSGSAD